MDRSKTQRIKAQINVNPLKNVISRELTSTVETTLEFKKCENNFEVIMYSVVDSLNLLILSIGFNLKYWF